MAEKQRNAKAHRSSVRTKKNEPGLKYDAGKPPMGLLSRVALEQEAQVLAFGADKYGAQNWRKGISLTRLLDAAIRHCVAVANGEYLDPESGLPHMAHARCMLGFALDLHDTTPEFNDLYGEKE